MARAILKTLKASYNGVKEDGSLPERLKIFNWGVNKSNQGDFIVDELTAKVFDDNQRIFGRETVAVDFNHNTVPDTDAFKAAAGSPAIAGYGRPVIIPNDGIYLEHIDTTQSGIEKARDYKDLSPAPAVDKETGRVIGIHSVALVPAGSVYDLTIETAAENAGKSIRTLSATLATLSVPNSKLHAGGEPEPNAYKNGTETFNNRMKEEHFAMIKQAMEGMPEDCSFEDVMEKLKAHWEGEKDGDEIGHRDGSITNKSNSSVIQWDKEKHMEMANAGLKMLEAKFDEMVKPLAAKLTTVQAELDAARAKADATTREELISRASREGKIIPLSADQLKDTATYTNKVLEGMISNLKPSVPLARTGVVPLSAADVKSLPRKTMADSAAAINRSIGLAPGARFKDIGVSSN